MEPKKIPLFNHEASNKVEPKGKKSKIKNQNGPEDNDHRWQACAAGLGGAGCKSRTKVEVMLVVHQMHHIWSKSREEIESRSMLETRFGWRFCQKKKKLRHP